MKSTLGIKFRLVLLLVVSSCILFGCCANLGHSFSMEYKYGRSFNAEREKKRIPLLPEGWGWGIAEENSITWTDLEVYWNGFEWGDGATPPSPRHYQKRLLVQEDTIIETDEYLGKITGTQYKDGEAIPIFETIKIIHTYHIIDEIDKISCSADVHTSDVEFVNGECVKAVEILEQWGLTYP